MAVKLTIDIFSGRKNPEVILGGEQENELLLRLRPGRELKPHERLAAPLSVLGYRGFIVEQLGRSRRGLPKSLRVANGDLIGEGLRHRASDEHVEEFVCGHRLSCNNCYNYASNYRTDNFAQPGMASGVSHSLTCATVIPAAVADGLIDSPGANNRCPDEGHLVALVMGPGWDYHWYRKGRNGYWSHKPGGTPVTNVDNNGALIRDPRTAARDGYTQFCTFMIVMHGHIKLKGPWC
jgi:hypothetical protein